MEQYFMPIYTSIVGVVIGLLVAKIKSLVQQKKDIQKADSDNAEALKEGMAILLRRQLFEYYGIYEHEDSIPAREWADIEETHHVYNRLGGNHTGDRLYEALRQKHIQG